MANIVPVARPVLLCREIRFLSSGTELVGLFDVLLAERLPHTQPQFSAVVQLSGGLGEFSVRFEVRSMSDGHPLGVSNPRTVRFPDRGKLVQLSTSFSGLRFGRPGIYAVELYCDDVWVGDTTFELREDVP